MSESKTTTLYSATWLLMFGLMFGGDTSAPSFDTQQQCEQYRDALRKHYRTEEIVCIEQDESGCVEGQGCHDR